MMKKVSVPEGKSGEYWIDKKELKPSGLSSEQAIYGDRAPGIGVYTRLCGPVETDFMEDGIIMSDTPAEMADHAEAVEMAQGHILINGLGIGMVLLNSLLKPEVIKATVIEKSPDVIALVGPHYEKMFGGRFELIHEDALQYQPPAGAHYGMVWHDIWPSICSDNLQDMADLRERYVGNCDWQGSWMEDWCEELAEDEAGHLNFLSMFASKHTFVKIIDNSSF